MPSLGYVLGEDECSSADIGRQLLRHLFYQRIPALALGLPPGFAEASMLTNGQPP
jgi:hypothetical protein